MKYIITLLLSPLALAAQSKLGTKQVVAPMLIIIAGESNATELALNDSTPSIIGVHQQIKRFDTLTYQFNTMNLIAGGNHSFEGGITKCSDSGTMGTQTFYIVHAGVSGSRIAYWNDSTYLHNTTQCWTRFKTRVDTAISLITAATGFRPALYVLWSQGINDSRNGMNPTVWRDSTTSFFNNKLRRRYGTVPIFMTYLTPDYVNYNPYILELTTTLQKVFYIDTTDLPTVSGDPNHWGTYGNDWIGVRFVAALRALFKYY